MIDYNYILTCTKEKHCLNMENNDISTAYLHFIFPYLELTDVNMLNDCNEEIPAKKVKVTGYYCNIDENYISIYLTIFNQFAKINEIISLDKFEECRVSMKNLIEMIEDNSYRNINESRPIYDLCDYIVSHENMEIIFNVITNYVVPLSYNKNGNFTFGNHNIGLRTYDINDVIDKINSISNNNHELNLVDKFGCGIPAVLISKSKDIDVYLTSFVGEWLAQLYKEDSIGLLSANVRSYLKRTNKVNKEIINTVKDTPQEFVAYNNGLSAIATEISITNQYDSNFIVIDKLKDFLIVNGGQTTATLYECKNDKLDLSKIIVPAKVSVIKNVSSSEYLISNISIFSNAQTAIKKSDPPSNSKFYKRFEELSKMILAKKNMIEYHCFFERTNGQYNTMKKLHSLSNDSFISLNPERCRFTKLQLAQAIVSWEQLPDIVCKGQEKNFEFFHSIVNDLNSNIVDEDYFKASYSLIIIYRKLDQLIKKEKLAYKSSLIAYSIAFLSLKCEKKLNLLSIWLEQDVNKDLENILNDIIKKVYTKLIDSPEKYPDIRMWARKPECWTNVKSISVEYNIADIEKEWEFFPENSAKMFIDSNFLNVKIWKDLESWGRNSNNKLNESQLNMIHGMPAIIYRGKISKRQESFAKSIFLIAVEEGYDYNKTY